MSTNNPTYTNELIHESSPYLLQHAHNPVNWMPWNQQALDKAKAENKPILVSIGYAACHWCHVMEKESFENEATAQLMNDWFVCIKVDREERPDLDQIYMDAVQALNGNGGWPLNVFLTPEGKPFYGGTYYPTKTMYNRMGWNDLLQTIHNVYTEKPETIAQQSQNLIDHLNNANAIGTPRSNAGLLSEEHLQSTKDELLKFWDKEWGGFSAAPKFPQTYSIQYLLRYAKQYKKSEVAEAALQSLDKMMQGGIYDHLGGGFSRYSTDKKWQIPHFEKMLYDNALLLSTLAEAFALTQEHKYAECIDETISFVQRELTSAEGTFYSSIDADSEGEEGKFYVWRKEEIDSILGSDSPIFCQVFDIWEDGNWEEKNIIWQPIRIEKCALQLGISLEELQRTIAICKQKLLATRADRIRPATDTKILLGWNALMIKGLADCYAAIGNNAYLEMALKAIQAIESSAKSSTYWLHSIKNKGEEIPAFLDDYAYLIEAYLRLQEVTSETLYIDKARKLTEFVIAQFSSVSSFFFYTSKMQKDIILRKKDIYDGATACGNSAMAHNLLTLSKILDKTEWKEKAIQMILSVGGGIVHYATSFGNWALLLQKLVWPDKEIVLIGADYLKYLQPILSRFDNNIIVMSATKENPKYPLLADKGLTAQTQFFLCENYQCSQPSSRIEEFMKKLEKA